MTRRTHSTTRYLLSALCLSLALGSGCASAGEKPHDAAHVEILRLKISKVRHATRETRETISRSQGAPYLPELYLRLAELLSEEAKYQYRLAQERAQGSAESLHVPQVRLLKEQAIGLYKTMRRRFPDSHMGDRVLFNMAYEHRELGNFDDMVATLKQLTIDFPKSALRYEALLLLGDYHFDRSELDKARGFYEKITPGEHARVKGMAHYKLAWIWVNKGDCKRALVEFEKSLDAERQQAQRARELALQQAQLEAQEGEEEDAPEEDGEALIQSQQTAQEDERAIDVRRSALVDLVYCYSQERPANKAVGFLKARAHDRASYVKALEKMARRLEVMNARKGARSVLRELMTLGPSNADRLDDARQMHGTLRAMKTTSQVGVDSILITDVLSRYLVRAEVSDEQRTSLRKEFEVYLRDLLTRAQEKLSDRKAAVDLARGYHAYTHAFSDFPKHTEMLRNMSAVLVTADRYYDAGQRSLQAAHASKEKQRKEALYEAVVRFQKALRPDASDADLHSRVVARAALRRAGAELLREKLDADQALKTKFAIAETLYQDGKYRQAIDLLTAVAYEHPGSSESNAAVRLVLDSYNTLNDFRGLIQAAKRFMAAGSPAPDSLKAEIKPILASAEQRRLDEVSLEAAGDEGGDYGILLRFAEQNAGTALGERALVNAFVAARALGQSEELYKLGGQLAQTYPKSEHLPGILATLGQMAVARFEVDRAIEFLRKAGNANHPQRMSLLLATGQLQEEMGDYAGAQQSYGAAIATGTGAAIAEPLSHLAVLLERRGDSRDLMAKLGPHADGGNPDVLARLGLTQLFSGQNDQAEMTLQTVMSAGTSASQEALARAHYGMAELMLATLDQYPALTDPELVEEYITIADVAQQSYLNAAREGSADYTVRAFGRLAYALEKVAARVKSANASAGLPPEQAAVLKQALDARAGQLLATAKEARGACTQQVWAMHSFGPAGRLCLAGKVLERPNPGFDLLQKGTGGAPPKGVEPLLKRIGVNPEDLDALRALGTVFLDKGQSHLARMVFESASSRGGGPLEFNLLGIAAAAVGDTGGALSAFTRSAEGGLEAGRQNLIKMLGKQGLSAAAEDAKKRFPKGREGGRLLGGGK